MHRVSALIVSRLLLAAVCAALSAPPLPAQTSVRRVQVLGSKDAVEIQVEASDRIVPQSRVLTSPDRLVIDFPNATPGAELRSQSVDRGQVKDIRIGLFQSKPPVTRLVLDLKSAQSYQVFPNGRMVVIKVMGGGASTSVDAGNSAAPPSRPGLVAANFTTNTANLHADSLHPVAVPANDPHPDEAAKPTLDVSFRDGLLKIKSDRATLAEVLNAIQQRTGAQISIAPGAEQERVVVDLGPAPAPEIVSRLLYGSHFNFLILSAANNPARLDRVILTPRADGGPMPLPQMQALGATQANQANDQPDAEENAPAEAMQPQADSPPPPRVDLGPRPGTPEIPAPSGEDPPNE